MGIFVGSNAARARVEARTHARRPVSGRSASEGARVFRSAQVQSHDDRSSVGSAPPSRCSALVARGPDVSVMSRLRTTGRLAIVGSLLPSSDEDMNKRPPFLVPDLHTVHAMIPESRKRGHPVNISRQCEAREHHLLGQRQCKQPDRCKRLVGAQASKSSTGLDGSPIWWPCSRAYATASHAHRRAPQAS
jgi:hypothetical protein